MCQITYHVQTTTYVNLFMSTRPVFTKVISLWTKWPPSHRRCFQMHFRKYKFCILSKISQKFLPTGPIDHYPALIHTMTWHRIGDKPLFEPMLTWFTGTYMRHWGIPWPEIFSYDWVSQSAHGKSCFVVCHHSLVTISHYDFMIWYWSDFCITVTFGGKSTGWPAGPGQAVEQHLV